MLVNDILLSHVPNDRKSQDNDVRPTVPSNGTELLVSDLTSLVKALHVEEDQSKTSMVDSKESVSSMVDVLLDQPTSPPCLYIDLEGINLSRQGTISILQIYVQSKQQTYLVDVHLLGAESFSTAGSSNMTLKSILESAAIPKVFFDVRNDSDALFSHYGIRLAGVQDLQLMELATRYGRKTYVNGLAKCIEQDAQMTYPERQAWKAAKEKGLKLFAPERGGSYEVFNTRPLAIEIQDYCVQDVEFLPRLRSVYESRLSSSWRNKVQVAVIERVRSSQSSTYQPHGRQKALGPW